MSSIADSSGQLPDVLECSSLIGPKIALIESGNARGKHQSLNYKGVKLTQEKDLGAPIHREKQYNHGMLDECEIVNKF